MIRRVLIIALLACCSIGLFVAPPVSAASELTEQEIFNMLKEPQPGIRLPGLEFSEATPENLSSTDTKGQSYIHIPFLGQYIKAIYQFSIAIISVIALVILIGAGLQWSLSAGNSTVIESAKRRIAQALSAMLIAFASYAILYIVNPKLVEFEQLKVLVIPKIEIEFEDIDEETFKRRAGAINGTVIERLIGELPSNKESCSSEAAIYTADKLHAENICMGPCHCAWTVGVFLDYIGCPTVQNGGATRINMKNENKYGWTTKPITDQNRDNLPFGVLFKNGHVGLSLGDGRMFDSGSTIAQLNQRAKKRGPEACISQYPDMVEENKNACRWCEKIDGEGPSSGNFAGDAFPGGTNGMNGPNPPNNSTRCRGNQAWSVRAKVDTRFTAIVVPPETSQTYDVPPPTQGCCLTAKGQRFIMSEALCELHNIDQKPPKGINAWWAPATITEVPSDACKPVRKNYRNW